MHQTVMIFGTFDVFHLGHRFFIEEARKRGKDLIIVVARDATVKRLKAVLRNPERVRQKILKDAFPKETVVLGDEKDPMTAVRKNRPSLVCLGYDQVGFSKILREQFSEIKIERLRAFHPEKYKSSMIR